MYESQSTVLTSLEQQATRLEALARNLEHSRAQLPLSAVGVWRGPAASVYGAALHGLVGELGAAAAQVDRALSNSRHALATLAARG